MKLSSQTALSPAELAAFTGDELIHFVITPLGTPASRKGTIDQLASIIASGGIIPLPKADILTLASSSLLNTKVRYLTTDLTDNWLVTPTSVNSISLFVDVFSINCDWNASASADYTGVVTVTTVPFTARKGLWTLALDPTLVDGDVVIYDNLHYQVISQAALNLDDPTTNAVAYQVLPKTSADCGYLTNIDKCFIGQSSSSSTIGIVSISDKYRNVNERPFDGVFPVNTHDLFRFNDNTCLSNMIFRAYVDNINSSSVFKNNEINNCYVVLSEGGGNFLNNTISGGGFTPSNFAVYFSGGTLSNCVIRGNSMTINLDVAVNYTDKTFIQGISSNFDATIDENVNQLTLAYTGVDVYLANDIITNLSTGGTATVVSGGAGTLILDNVYGAFNDGDSLFNSTTSATVVVNGETVYPEIDLGAGNNFVGEFTINSTETSVCARTFINYPECPFIVRPAAGKTLTIEDSNTMKLSGGTTAVLTGDNGDWIKFEVRLGIIYQIGGETYINTTYLS